MSFLTLSRPKRGARPRSPPSKVSRPFGTDPFCPHFYRRFSLRFLGFRFVGRAMIGFSVLDRLCGEPPFTVAPPPPLNWVIAFPPLFWTCLTWLSLCLRQHQGHPLNSSTMFSSLPPSEGSLHPQAQAGLGPLLSASTSGDAPLNPFFSLAAILPFIAYVSCIRHHYPLTLFRFV